MLNSNRVCKLCENNTSSKWLIGNTLLDKVGSHKDSEVLADDWICGGASTWQYTQVIVVTKPTSLLVLGMKHQLILLRY